MDILDLKNLQLSYQAIYDQSLCESMEELGIIGDTEYLEEERAEGVKPYKKGRTQAEVREDEKQARKKHVEKAKGQTGYGPEEKFKSDWKLRSTPSSTFKRKSGEEETVSQRMNREQPYKDRPFSPLFTKQGSRTASAVTRVTEGPGEPQAVTMPRKGREEPAKRRAKPSREIIRRGKQEESFDLYDAILEHLINEGFAETEEAAVAIMSNMSEAWVDSIING